MKSEIRNPNVETNSKSKIQITKTVLTKSDFFFNFEHLNFGIVSDFVLRASNLKQGFTLIEVLVVATIIGILSTIGISSFQAVTRSGRDALRRADLEQIRSALEIYKSENGSYPAATGCRADLTADYINSYPPDPKSSAYNYCYIKGGSILYRLCAHLENGGTSDNCDGGNKCDSDPNDGITGNCNYQVTNP